MMLMFLMAGAVFAGTIELPQTGQTKCYDTIGNEIACTRTGQDGEIQAGVEWPRPRFTVRGEVVTDNLTGLMWTKNGNLYNGAMTWDQAIASSNNLNLGGYTDWRLPNVNELESLINANEADSATWLNVQGFTNVQAGNYWSSTSYAYYPGSAWIINMCLGYMGAYYKSGYYGFYVWPVRGGQVPTLIELSTFTATPSGRVVILEWTTASEIDNAGFNLYRAESEDGEYVKINNSLIPAKGSPTSGTTYQYIDNEVRNRETYYYKLEDIDLNGTSTMHGPVSAEVKRFGTRD